MGFWATAEGPRKWTHSGYLLRGFVAVTAPGWLMRHAGQLGNRTSSADNTTPSPKPMVLVSGVAHGDRAPSIGASVLQMVPADYAAWCSRAQAAAPALAVAGMRRIRRMRCRRRAAKRKRATRRVAVRGVAFFATGLLKQWNAPRSAQQAEVVDETQARIGVERSRARVELFCPGDAIGLGDLGRAVHRHRIADHTVRFVEELRRGSGKRHPVAARHDEERRGERQDDDDGEDRQRHRQVGTLRCETSSRTTRSRSRRNSASAG
jgi:hypothetical protein